MFSLALPNLPSTTEEIARKTSNFVFLVSPNPKFLENPNFPKKKNKKSNLGRNERNYLTNMIFVEANIGCPSFVLHFDTIFEDFPIVDEGHQLCLLGLQHSHQTVENLVPFLPIG